MKVGRIVSCILVIGAVVYTVSAVGAQEADPQYEELKKSNEQLRKEVEQLKSQMKKLLSEDEPGEAKKSEPARAEAEPEKEANIDRLNQRLRAVEKETDSLKLGDTRSLISGYATAGYTDREMENSSFSGTFNPIFLWELNDRLLFESELHMALEDGETELELEYADLSYLVNDYMTVGAGKFLTPFGIFPERLHPAWINKLPDNPLPFLHHGGFAPISSLGGFLRGGVPLGAIKGNYSFYVSNGPTLETEGHHVGSLDFGNYEDLNNNVAVGGRVGLLPIPTVPQFEVGYSFQVADVAPSGFNQDVNSLLQAVDLSYVKESKWLKGKIDLRSELVLSDVDDATFTTHDGPLTFDNERSGGYIQGAYRPTLLQESFLKDCEVVYRYDWTNQPSEVASDEQRNTIGMNYWLNPSTVFKVAYEMSDTDNGEDQDAILLQAAIGF